MFNLKCYIIFALFSILINVCTQSQNDNVKELNYSGEDNIPVKFSDWDVYWTHKQLNDNDGDQVGVKLYYESLCPDCIQFDKEQFNIAVQMLSQYVDFRTYPYGNAKTIKENGVINFICQHGPKECYGNKLHACAIDQLKNITESVAYNSCMMGGEDRGSDDAAADRCAAAMGIDSKPIKTCAKGDRGTALLEYYGEESKKANFSYVPYILINGKENDGSNFMRDICAAFAVSPPPCVEYSVLLIDQIL